jgi:hypothetical protein
VAPGGYYTSGAQVCTAQGERHVFHGVDRPSLEWEPNGSNLSEADFIAIAGWHANVVRIGLNQDFWLPNAYLYSSGYADTVDQVIAWAHLHGLDVILDLHWSDQGNLQVQQAGGQLPNSTKYVSNDTAGYSIQQPMADENSVTFWQQVAARYKDDGHVFFELYNEPNGISWDVWLNGGMTKPSGGFMAAGMQALYNAVRGAGADNLVIAGGVDWAFDLSGVASHPIQGYNIMYASHPYSGNDTAGQWASSFGYLATQNIAPVILTEFGDDRANICTGNWDSELIAYAAPLQISWSSWAWYVGDPCTFPSLLSDWGYDTTAQGAVVKAALANDPAPVTWIDAGPTDAASDSNTDGSLGDGATGGDAAANAEDATAAPEGSADVTATSDGGEDATATVDAGGDETAGDEEAADAATE